MPHRVFDNVHPRVSADVLVKGTRERSETRGLLWMELDVITISVYGQRLETIKFAISYRVFQRSHRPAASDHYERNRPEEGAKARG
jgi:hypothetical protein